MHALFVLHRKQQQPGWPELPERRIGIMGHLVLFCMLFYSLITLSIAVRWERQNVLTADQSLR